MTGYILQRLLLIIPTLFGILVINFLIVQAAPGGPVEQTIAKIKHHGATEGAFAGKTQQSDTLPQTGGYRGARGLDPAMIRELEERYGFDKPPLERFLLMLGNYLRFDFGKSFYSDRSVLSLIRDKLPVSISLGLWTTLLVYLISIPLGIAKAVRDGSSFDAWSSLVIIIGYAVPGFLFAILLIVLFAGGSFWDLFPLRGLASDQWQTLSWPARIVDYCWHITLPVFAMVIGGFASLTLLTKNAFLDEIHKTYVTTARAKGLTESQIRYRHVFRNAMLLVIAGFPAALIGILFTSSLLIEVIFSLDGLGLLSFEAIVKRDYPIVFGTLYIFTLLGLVVNLLGDLTYRLIDPRIDFTRQAT